MVIHLELEIQDLVRDKTQLAKTVILLSTVTQIIAEMLT
jgi:hypothetical protein